MSGATPDLTELSESVDSIKTAVNVGFVLFSGFLVFFMQAGFAMLSAGSVRTRNAKSIILKNLLDGLYWWAIGYAFAFGDHTTTNAAGDTVVTQNAFIGSKYFFFTNLPTTNYVNWFFQFAFAAATSTIVIGAIEERMKFEAYFSYNALLLCWVYPIIVHAVWSNAGWLGAFRQNGTLLYGSGMIDFAGSGVVHLTGGTAALIGAALLGPRMGRFVNGKPVEMPGHNASLAILGVFLLWFGWYGFNPGSALMIVGAEKVVMQAAITTTLSGCAAGFSAMLTASLIRVIKEKSMHYDLILAGNGALVGLVSITAGCAVVEAWAAVVIGLIAGAIYVGASKLVAQGMKVDDPLDAIAVHGFGGLWGVIAVGLFASSPLVDRAYGPRPDTGGSRKYGCFMGSDGHLLACQIAGVSFIFAWTAAHMGLLFGGLKYFGLLRCAPEEETAGLDVSRHGGHAYPEEWAASMHGVKAGAAAPPAGAEVLKQLEDMQSEIMALKAQVKTNGTNGAAV